MAEIAVTPLTLTDVVIDIDGNDYGAAVSSVAFTPSASNVTFKGLKPGAVFTDVTNATWTCDITYAQDWDSATSLARYLFDNAGDAVDATFRPRTGVGPSFDATLLITPGAIGGAVDATATATVSLGVRGKPVLVPAA